MLETAREHFAANGYHATTMEDIADASNVSKPVLYQHFTGKKELYDAVFDAGVAAIESHVTGPLGEDIDNLTRTRDMVQRFIDVVIHDPETYRVVFESDMMGIPSISDRVYGLIDRVSARLFQTFREQTPLSAKDSAFLSQTLVNLAISSAREIAQAPTEEDQARQQFLLFKLAWGGIDRIDEDWIDQDF